MEAIALDSFCEITPWDRKEFRDSRHRAVKRCIKAGDLGQFRMTEQKGFDQINLAGEMIGIVWRDASQFRQQFSGNSHRLRMFHAVDDSMPDSLD